MVSSSREERELEALHREAMLLMSKHNSDSALKAVRVMLDKAKKSNSIKYLGASLGIKGYVYYGLNEPKLAIDNFEKSLNFYSKKPELFFNEIKQTKNSLGVLYKNIAGKILLEIFLRLQEFDTIYKRSKERHVRDKTGWW